MPTINSKSTKTEILDAYTKLLGQLDAKDQTVMDPVKEKEIKRKVTSIADAEAITSGEISDSVDGLKIMVQQYLEKIISDISEQVKKYETLSEAISIKEEELKEMYAIERAANTLAALINSNNEIREKFETEMAQKKSDLKTDLEQMQLDITKKRIEFEAQLKKEKEEAAEIRRKEEEEYSYNFNRRKKTELDQLQDELNEREKDFEESLSERNARLSEKIKSLSEREEKLSIREEKMDELEDIVASIPKMKIDIEEKAKEDARKKVEQTAAIKENYLKKEFESQKMVLENKIDMLEGSIKDKDAKIIELTAKLDAAYDKIQNMALKTVEGSSNSATMNQLERMLQEKGNVNK